MAPSSEAFVRWQQNTREQLSSANNLFLTYSVAVLGLQLSVLMSQGLSKVSAPGWFKAAVGAAMISFVTGAAVTVLRLQDARTTMRVTRLRQHDAEPDALAESRETAALLGNATWRWFWVQLSAFVVAAVCLVTWAYQSFSVKLQ
jgi:hypothetical protein